MKYLGKIYTLSIIGLFVSVLYKVYFSNCLVVDNHWLTELYTQKNELQKEISRLSYVENGLSSLSNVESRAVGLGFVSMENTLLGLNVNTSLSIAYNSSN